MIKANVIAFGAHPDDVELSAGATVCKLASQGKIVVLVDLTRGELGTRGSSELRKKESDEALKIMGAKERSQLNLGDGFFEINEDSLHRVVEVIRYYKPEIILANAKEDRHPDHSRGGDLVERAAFLAGLPKIETNYLGVVQKAWRPNIVLRYVQDYFYKPDFVFDVTGFHEQKMKAIGCYSSQFYDPKSTEPETPISNQSFLELIKLRLMLNGRYINTQFGEGFTCTRPLGLTDISQLL